jgi:hypothetical protein
MRRLIPAPFLTGSQVEAPNRTPGLRDTDDAGREYRIQHGKAQPFDNP